MVSFLLFALKYLGKNAITDTLCFWEPDRTHVDEHASILIIPDNIDSIFLARGAALQR